MSRKPRKGYFVRGQFVAEGSAEDLQYKQELHGDVPSKTRLKQHSTDLQDLGEQLLELRADLLEPLDLPTRLLDALAELTRIKNFEGRRRQSQYLGKLMRQLDENQVQAIEAALQAQRQPSAAATLLLHQAENWRERLIADDGALGDWLQIHPETDVQQLRALVRQARKDAPTAPPAPGQAPRQSRTFRQLFQLLHQSLQATASSQEPDHE